MKKWILGLLLFISLGAAAQPSNYIKINGRYRWIAGMFDSTFHIPRFNGSPSLRTGGSSMDGAIAIDTTNNIFYFYSGGSWNSSNVDTSSAFITGIYKSSDSIFYIKGGVHYFAFKDSTGGSSGGGISQLGAGWGLDIVNDSTYRVDSSLVSTKYQTEKTRDSLAALINAKLNSADFEDSVSNYISGTTDYIPRFTGTNKIGNSSLLYDNGTNAGSTAKFLAPSMGSATNTAATFEFNLDGNLGVGPRFNTDGSYIQNLWLANYHYTMSVNTPSKGYYVGAYKDGTNNAYMLFKPVGKRVMFNTQTDSSHQYVFIGTSFKSDADTVTFSNVPTAPQAYIAMFDASGRMYKQDTTGLFGGGSSFYPTAISYTQSTRTLAVSRNGTSDITTTLPEATTSLPGLQSAADKDFLDSLHAGLITDSVYYRLITGPTTHDSAYAYVSTYGDGVIDSTFMFLIPKSGGGGSGTVNLGTQYRLGYYATTGTAISEAAAITASRALVSDANGLPTHSSVTATELGYVSGVTSAIQTQINALPTVARLADSIAVIRDSISVLRDSIAALRADIGTGGGGSYSGPTFYTVTSAVSSPASTSYTDITGLSFTATAGQTYVIDANLSVSVNVATTGAKFAINGPASPTFVSTSYFYPTTSSGVSINNHATYDAASASSSSANLSNPLYFRATIKTSTTGTVTLRFGSEIATAASVIINEGSYMAVSTQ